jgi:hypothetical protein
VFNTEVFEGLSQGVHARVLERLEVVENPQKGSNLRSRRREEIDNQNSS